ADACSNERREPSKAPTKTIVPVHGGFAGAESFAHAAGRSCNSKRRGEVRDPAGRVSFHTEINIARAGAAKLSLARSVAGIVGKIERHAGKHAKVVVKVITHG